LKGLDTLLASGFSQQRLCELAARLGADVPFFIPCRPARVTGIGEVLVPAPPLPLRWIVLIVPYFGVSTPWAYRRFDELVANGASVKEHGNLAPGQWPTSIQLRNDLELAVLPAHPEIGHIKDRLLQAGADGALMSGSGSSVFGVFQDRVRAERAVDALRQYGRSFLATPLNATPSV
jgi:4-diphosphocytidyl-2-C-methyl-D-erythritol kinase